MAAVTSTIVALGGLGLSAAQAIKANKDMKTASQAAEKAAGELKNIKEFNAFKQVQVPTLGFNMAQESKAQGTTQALQALQGAGAEGVIGGVGNVVQAGNEQDLQLAAKLGELEYQKNMSEAESQQGIEARRQEREYLGGINKLKGAQMQRVAGEEKRNEAIGGIFESLGGVATGISGLVPLYGKQGTNNTNVSQGQIGYGVYSNEGQQQQQQPSWNWALKQP